VTPTHLAAMTGLEVLRWEAESRSDIPSIRRLLGMRFDVMTLAASWCPSRLAPVWAAGWRC